MTKPEREINEFMRYIGALGGKANGDRKRRSPEHYQKMVAARQAKREALKTENVLDPAKMAINLLR
jgi:hypothetical protein